MVAKTEETKTCQKCTKRKSTDSFSRHKKNSDGLQSRCKLCVSTYQREHYIQNRNKILSRNKKWSADNPGKARAVHKSWRDRNREWVRQRDKNWRTRNPEKAKVYQTRYANKNPNRSRARRLKAYGLTIQDYNRLLESQGGVCSICKKTDDLRPNLSVDHDHVTGMVRGLLCTRCNSALGIVLEDVKTINAMAQYLELNQKKGGQRQVKKAV